MAHPPPSVCQDAEDTVLSSLRDTYLQGPSTPCQEKPPGGPRTHLGTPGSPSEPLMLLPPGSCHFPAPVLLVSTFSKAMKLTTRLLLGPGDCPRDSCPPEWTAWAVLSRSTVSGPRQG